MPDLLTITFSPCIDKTVTITGLLPEKKMHCTRPVFEPGGGGINIARAIKKLGGAATALYPAGGCMGNQFEKLLQLEAVPAIVIETGAEMRENLNVLDTSSNQQYRFVMPAVELAINEIQAILDALHHQKNLQYIIVSGSLPNGVPKEIFQQIGKIAQAKKIRLIVDTSHEALMHTRNAGVYLIKPNLAELSLMAGRKEIHLTEIDLVAREVINNGYCEIVVVSIGSNGAMLITNQQVFRAIPPVIKPQSTVGAGDSLVAGLILSLSNGRSLEDSLRYGVSCGTAACLNPGTALCNKTDVDQIFALTRVFNA